MELQIVSKKENDYILNTLQLPSGSGTDFFSSLRDNILNETDKIRDAINTIIEKNGASTSKSKPKVDDYDEQVKLDRLGYARRLNLDSLNTINELLRYDDFIICECGAIMLKKPINVRYERVGNCFKIHADDNKGQIEYHYNCENCWRSIKEDIYQWTQMNKKRRERLLAEGETWVPDDGNYWYHDLSRRQTPNIKDTGCSHTHIRLIEKYALPNKNNSLKVDEFMTIKDKCTRCGEVITIK